MGGGRVITRPKGRERSEAGLHYDAEGEGGRPGRPGRRRAVWRALPFPARGAEPRSLQERKKGGGSRHNRGAGNMQPQEREHSDGEAGTRDRLQPRDRLKGQPQKRQHSDVRPHACGGTGRGTDCARRGVHYDLARGMEARRAETPLLLILAARFTTTRSRAAGRTKLGDDFRVIDRAGIGT